MLKKTMNRNRCFRGTRMRAALVLILASSARLLSAEAPPPFTILGHPPEYWATRLSNSETLKEQRLAVYCLGEFGPDARETVPVLRTTVRETRYAEVRWLAIEALGLVGADAAVAVPELLAILADENIDAGLRRKALEAVARIAPESPEVARAVLGAMNSSIVVLRHAALDAAVTVVAFSRSAEVLAALTRAARADANAEPATRALRCLGADGVQPLIEVLGKGEDAARRAAAENLARMGELVRPVQGPISKLARREKKTEVRVALLKVLGGLAPGDADVLVLARELLGETAEEGIAARVLKEAGAAALPHLREAFKLRDESVRKAALGLCASLGEVAAPLAGEVVRLVSDKNEDVRLAAADALNRMGPAAAQVHGTLQSLAESASGPLRRAIELAAVNVSRPAGSPPHRSPLEILSDEQLVGLLREGRQTEQRVDAATVLRERGNVGLEPLAAALDDAALDVRVAAAKSLAFRGEAAKGVAGKLVSWLGFPELKLQQAALAALAAIGPAAPESLDRLVQFAMSPDAPDDVTTGSLLGFALRAHGAEAAVRLAEGLKSRDNRVVVRAAQALGQLGEMAVAVHAELQAAALSTDDGVVKAVVDTICRLGPEARADVPMLVRFLSYAATTWRRAAAEALGSIQLDYSKGDTFGVIDGLLPVLLDQDPDTAWSAYLALYLIGDPVLPKLRWLMRINEGEVPFPVLRVMAKLKADPDVIVPKLVALCRPGNRSEERATAAELLALYGPEYQEGLPVLVDMLRDRSDVVVRAALRVLESYGKAALPVMEGALRGRDPVIRQQALEWFEILRNAK